MTRTSAKGLRQFLTAEQQRDWMDGKAVLPDANGRSESLEHRFKYAARMEKLMRRPQAEEVLAILRIYGETCLPIPRTTERYYWSVSCLPSTDKTLARVNAAWMELFALQPDESSPLVGEDKGGGPAASAAEENYLLAKQPASAASSAPPHHPPHKGEGLLARFILHLSDFTTDGSPEPDQLDHDLIDQCVRRPEACPEQSRRNVSHFIWKDDTFGLKVRGGASIRHFLAHPHALRAIRRFNLTHMNRGRNAYQASHCYSLADHMVGG
ncbi:MAG TPA: hypothetical protein VGD23_03045 [Sphingomicrobium sp.]